MERLRARLFVHSFVVRFSHHLWFFFILNSKILLWVVIKIIYVITKSFNTQSREQHEKTRSYNIEVIKWYFVMIVFVGRFGRLHFSYAYNYFGDEINYLRIWKVKKNVTPILIKLAKSCGTSLINIKNQFSSN
jgi:hypothetical protein